MKKPKRIPKKSYPEVFKPHEAGLDFNKLPGFTRSAYERNHALISVESRVWSGLSAWKNTKGAVLISPASGANFTMYLASMAAHSTSSRPPPMVERFVIILEGSVKVVNSNDRTIKTLRANNFVYFPPDATEYLKSLREANLLVYERVYGIGANRGNYMLKKGVTALAHDDIDPFGECSPPVLQFGNIDKQPLLDPGTGETFKLRKLLPQSAEYDFNVHIMDLEPGETLWTKELHYNQHGLLMLEGQGIYRLGDKWYPVQTGDAIYMGPYCMQWYGALGKGRTRYVIYKDVTVDPLFNNLPMA